MAKELPAYQEYAANFIVNTPRCALFFDMGLGKTRITLEALSRIKLPGHVLIVAPKNIARSTWLDEIKKWDYKFNVQSLLVDEKGKDLTKNARHKLYLEAYTNKTPTIYFINREKIPDIVENAPVIDGYPRWCFPIVVIDESQSFKSYNSQRFKSIKEILSCTERFIELTGTPTPNGLMDLWPQIYMLDGGQRLGPTITSYRNEFFIPTLYVQNHPVQWAPKQGAEKRIYDAISPLVISMKNTAIKLPALTINDIPIHMSNLEMRTYKKLMKEKVIEFGNEEITAANAAVLSNKLRQMASGALYLQYDDATVKTNGVRPYVVIHQRKLEQCEYIINNTNSPVLIAYEFHSDMDMLLQYFSIQHKKDSSVPVPEVFDGSPEMIARWNRREIKVMMIQPQSAGHGLNIQAGGHTLIWFSMPWSLEHYEQTNARLYRQGQTEPVVIHRLLTLDTVDGDIAHALEKKDCVQENLLKAVKAAIKI